MRMEAAFAHDALAGAQAAVEGTGTGPSQAAGLQEDGNGVKKYLQV